MSPETVRRQRTSAGVAVVGVLVGLAYLAIGAAQGQWGFGAAGLAIMLAYTGLMYGLRRRAEPAALLSGNPSDERQAVVMLRASAFTGNALIAAIVIGMFVSMSLQSRYTSVFVALAAGGGACFVAATVWFSRRG